MHTPELKSSLSDPSTRSSFLAMLATDPELTASGSRYSGMVWDFTEETRQRRIPLGYRRIDFRMVIEKRHFHREPRWLPDGRSLVAYPELFTIAKELFAASILVPRNYRGTPFSVSHLVNLWTGYRVLVSEMTRARVDSFSLLTTALLNRIISKRRSLPLCRALKHLTIYQDLLGIRFLFSARDVTNTILRKSKTLRKQTRPIDDRSFIALLDFCIQWVQQRSVYTLRVYRSAQNYKYANYLAPEDGSLGCPSRSLHVKLPKRFWTGQAAGSSATSESDFKISAPADLAESLSWLRYSAIVLIASLTGMRVSEISALRDDALFETDDCGIRLWWLKGLHTKFSERFSGESATWLCGPLAARAFSILKELSNDRRERLGCSFVIGPLDFGRGRSPANFMPRRLHRESADFARKLFARSPKKGEKQHWHAFLRKCGLFDSQGAVRHIHAHQFRRTFARWCARSDNQTGLLALRDHFKHASFLMTHYYSNVDEELLEHYEIERRDAQVEGFDALLKADAVAGVGGVIVKGKIDSAIEQGILPPFFRGSAYSHGRRELALKWLQSGLQLRVCGGHFCIPRDGNAHCDAMNGWGCNVNECSRAVFLKDHAPGLAARICTEKAALELQIEYNPNAPYVSELEKMIRAEERILSQLGAIA